MAITIGSIVACVLSLHKMLRIKSMVKLFNRIELTVYLVDPKWYRSLPNVRKMKEEKSQGFYPDAHQ